MQVLSTSLLAHSEQRAVRAVQFFTQTLGLRPLWGLQHPSRKDVLTAGIQLPSGAVIEVITLEGGLDQYTVRGQYDKAMKKLRKALGSNPSATSQREPRSLKLLAVHIGSPSYMGDTDALKTLSTAALPSREDETWKQWVSYGGYATGLAIQPQVFAWSNSGNDNNDTNKLEKPTTTGYDEDGGDDSNEIRTIKEVILANDFETQKSNEANLRKNGFVRDSSAISVWHSKQGNPEPSSTGVRVLPGHFPALVLGVNDLDRARQSFEDISKGARIQISEYGRKSGIDQGQLLIESDDIPGLDLRLCSRKYVVDYSY